MSEQHCPRDVTCMAVELLSVKPACETRSCAVVTVRVVRVMSLNVLTGLLIYLPIILKISPWLCLRTQFMCARFSTNRRYQ